MKKILSTISVTAFVSLVGLTPVFAQNSEMKTDSMNQGGMQQESTMQSNGMQATPDDGMQTNIIPENKNMKPAEKPAEKPMHDGGMMQQDGMQSDSMQPPAKSDNM